MWHQLLDKHCNQGKHECVNKVSVEHQTEIIVTSCVSVPDEGSVSEDRNAPPSPEDRDSGLFMLKKDSERRAILYKVLNDDQEKVISNLKENHIQVCVCVFTFAFIPHYYITDKNA